ncbi:hypothetical protein [Aureimonas endophytica]|uniref:hypothetical protein n=1 Tax=Aureimonas endophytica TaxID=2027858 RepID=UPI00166323F7|nr:hypothetical protein [Aureimonas endophytica]
MRHQAATCTFITAAFYLALISISAIWSLDGNLSQYVRPGGATGAPSNHIKNGFQITLDKDGVGWDGSFYFYIADDLIITDDTIKHLDMPAYRYQRIGLGLVARILSWVTASNWVSPIHFLIASFAIIIAGVYFLARFFEVRGASPFLTLAWSIGGAPLFTLIFAFTDGAGDAFLALAIVALLSNRFVLYLVLSAMAALCRESLILLPLACGTVGCIHQIAQGGDVSHRLLRGLRAGLAHTPPIIVVAAWQIYIFARTGAFPFQFTPTTQFSFPMLSSARYFWQSIGHEIVSFYGNSSTWFPPFFSAIGIFLFSALNAILLISLLVWISKSIKTRGNGTDAAISGLVCFGIATCALHLCFGDVMMWIPVGYVKASSTACLIAILLVVAIRPPFLATLVAASFANSIFGAATIWFRLFP